MVSQNLAHVPGSFPRVTVTVTVSCPLGDLLSMQLSENKTQKAFNIRLRLTLAVKGHMHVLASYASFG